MAEDLKQKYCEGAPDDFKERCHACVNKNETDEEKIVACVQELQQEAESGGEKDATRLCVMDASGNCT